MDLSFIKHSTYEIFVTLIYILNFSAVLHLIFREKRDTQTTMAWILILLTIPALGFILYITFGHGISKDNMFKIKEEEDRVLKKNIVNTHAKLECDNNLDPILSANRDIIYTLANSNYAHYSVHNTVDIYEKPADFFDSLLEELKSAKEYINIQFYIFKDDDIGNKVIDILLEKIKEGVEVRLLYDAVGSRLFSDKSILKLKQAGVKVGCFFPSFMKVVNFNLNYRNHRKIVVIDGNVGFVGGNNVGDEYLGKDPKFGYWRDTHLKLTGESVRDLNIRFILDWRFTTQENLELDKYFVHKNVMVPSKNSFNNVGVQIASSGPDITELDEIKYGYMKLIQNAKKYVYIQSPYFILDKTFIDILRVACLSGVDVRIMIPSKPDHPFVYWASYSYAGELLKFGAKLYTYDENAFLHAKTIVMDDSVCSIGTANMDIRSFELNFEVNAFMYSEQVAKRQKQIFEDDMLKSREITLDIYNSRSNLVRAKQSISRLLSPVL